MASRGATDELIGRLAREAAPVRRVPRLRTGLAASLLAWGATALVITLCSGPWPRALLFVSRHVDSGLVLAGLAALGGGALIHALAAAVPGREGAARLGIAIAASGLAGIAIAILRGHFAPADPLYLDHPLRWDLFCIGYAALAALPTAAVGVSICMRCPPWRRRETALAIALGSSALGAGLVQALCGEGSARHTIGSHVFTPLLAVGVLGALLLLDAVHAKALGRKRARARARD